MQVVRRGEIECGVAVANKWEKSAGGQTERSDKRGSFKLMDMGASGR